MCNIEYISKNWVTVKKWRRCKNGYTVKIKSHLEKCVPLLNVKDILKNGSLSKNWSHCKKWDHIRKNGPHCETWVTVLKTGKILDN